MKHFIRTVFAVVSIVFGLSSSSRCVVFADTLDTDGADKQRGSVYDFSVQDIDGKEVSLSKYKGKVSLIVNVASRCGLTPQYEKLVSLYDTYRDQGLAILAFPANNFNRQEPGTNAEIKEFCSTKYKVTFDVFAKISVAGDDIAPLYRFLTEDKTNPGYSGPIEWNFSKFLVNRDGRIIGRFGPRIAPDSREVVTAIQKALDMKEPEETEAP